MSAPRLRAARSPRTGTEASRQANAVYERAYAQVATLILKGKGTDDDLVQMKVVSEDNIIQMLRKRFERDLIYVSRRSSFSIHSHSFVAFRLTSDPSW
jgi:hypothetical protein